MSKLTTRVFNFIYREDPEMYRRILSELTQDEVDNMSMRELNNYFRLALAKAPVSTTNERECLVSGLSDDAWLDYFENTVFPTLTKYSLPQL